MSDEDISQNDYYFHNNNVHGNLKVQCESITCPNPNCREFSFTIKISQVFAGPLGGQSLVDFERWTLRPKSSAKPLPPYVPAAIVSDYSEACAIRDLSPKASATLSRRCLQGMIRDFWGISLRTLNDEINALEDKIDGETWRAIDAIRKVGNIGAHMERDINIVVDVEPGEAALLIEMIEMLIKEWYVARQDRQDRLAKLVDLADEKAAAKKQAIPLADSPPLPSPGTAG